MSITSDIGLETPYLTLIKFFINCGLFNLELTPIGFYHNNHKSSYDRTGSAIPLVIVTGGLLSAGATSYIPEVRRIVKQTLSLQ